MVPGRTNKQSQQRWVVSEFRPGQPGSLWYIICYESHCYMLLLRGFLLALESFLRYRSVSLSSLETSSSPSARPSASPSAVPSGSPSGAPSAAPSAGSSAAPSAAPTVIASSSAFAGSSLLRQGQSHGDTVSRLLSRVVGVSVNKTWN
jgi:hypothetical protein